MQRVWVVVVVAACGASDAPSANPTAEPTPAPVEPVAAAAMADAAVPLDAAAARGLPVRPAFAVIRARPGIDIVESANHASHFHGGKAARIHHAVINVVVKDARPHTVATTKIELLRGHCRTTTWASRKALSVTGYQAYNWTDVKVVATGTNQVTLPATSELFSVSIEVTPESAYQACDRFAFAAQLVVDGSEVSVELPLEITRYESIDP